MRLAHLGAAVLAVILSALVAVALWQRETATRSQHGVKTDTDGAVVAAVSAPGGGFTAPAPRRSADASLGRHWTERFGARVGAAAGDPAFFDDFLAVGPEGPVALGALLGDLEPLRGMRDGDLEAGLEPPEVGLREFALLLLEATVVHRRATSEVRESAIRTLSELVAARPPGTLSAEATSLLLSERGRALAWLLLFSPEHASGAFRGIEESEQQSAISRIASGSLQGPGPRRERARQLLRSLQGA